MGKCSVLLIFKDIFRLELMNPLCRALREIQGRRKVETSMGDFPKTAKMAAEGFIMEAI